MKKKMERLPVMPILRKGAREKSEKEICRLASDDVGHTVGERRLN